MESSKDLVIIPEEEVIVSFEVTDDKPFNKCFECHSLRNGCSGPNLSVMGVARVCEFLQMARIFFKKSYQDVADGTGLSLATVKRTLTGKISDPSFYTISQISVYLLGDPMGKYPCAIPNIVSDVDNDMRLNDALRELELALDDNKDYKAALDNIHVSYKVEMDTIRSEAQEKIDYLKAQTERLNKEIDYLWAENSHKSKVIGILLENKK